MQIEQVLSVGGCCCFDLKTGGLIIGYIDVLLLSAPMVMWLSDNPTSFWFLFACAFAAMNVAYVYGIHKNQPKYMLCSVLWSLLTACFFIGFMIILGFLMLGFSDLLLKIKSHILSFMVDEKMTAELDQTIQVFDGGVMAIFAFVWIVLALCTTLVWYFAKVKFSLYQAMDRLLNVTWAQRPAFVNVNLTA